MADDASIRTGLKTRLDTITGLSVYKFMPGQVNVPAAVIQRRRTEYDKTMADGSDDWEYVVTVMVSWANPEVGQSAMSAYLARTGSSSIKAAIEGDATLGGAVDFAHVREAGEEQIRAVGEIEYLSVDYTIEVTA